MKFYSWVVLSAVLLAGCSNKYLVEGHEYEGMKVSMSRPLVAFDYHTWFTGTDIPAVAKGYYAVSPDKWNMFCEYATDDEVERIKDVVLIPADEELVVKKYFLKPESVLIPIGIFALATYDSGDTGVLLERSDGFQFFIDNYYFETLANGFETNWSKESDDDLDPFYGFYAEKKDVLKVRSFNENVKQAELLNVLREKGGHAVDKGDYVEIDRQAMANYYVKACHEGLFDVERGSGPRNWSGVIYKGNR